MAQAASPSGGGPAAVVYIATSLDGFIARSDGGVDWLPHPDGGEDFGWAEFMAGVDALVMGRNTFETVLSFEGPWPYEGTPVIVLSTTLKEVPSNLAGKVTLSSKPPPELLQELDQRGAKRVYIDGGRTIKGFLELDAVEEMIITVVPKLLGGGIRLFDGLDLGERDLLEWDVAGTTTLEVHGGLVKTTYRRKR